MADEDLPVITESAFNARFGGVPKVEDIPTITESEFNSRFAQPKTAPLSAGETFTGGMIDLFRKGTLGLGDEILAGINAPIDALGDYTGLYEGKPLGEAYDARLAQARDLSERYAEEHPYASFLNNALGLKMPLPGASFSKAKGLLPAVQNVAKAGTIGAAYGGAGGFAEGEGGLLNRLQNAEQGAELGAAFGGGLQGLSEGAQGLIRGGKSLFNALTLPFSKQGQEAVAGAVLRDYAQNPLLGQDLQAALQAQQADPFLASKSTAEVLQNPGLAGLQKALERGDAQSLNDLAARTADRETLRQQLANAMAAKGIPGASAVQDDLVAQAQRALADAQISDARLPSNIDLMQAGEDIRQPLQGGFTQGKDITKSLFQAIPERDATTIPTDKLKSIEEIAAKYYGPGYRELPGDLKQLVGKMQQAGQISGEAPAFGVASQYGAAPKAPELTSFDYLSNLRSFANDLQRGYGAKADGSRGAALAGEAKALIDNVIEDAATKGAGFTPQQAAAYQGAVDTRRLIAETYQRGAPARVLQKGMGGDYALNSSNVPRTFYSTSPESLRQFQKALGGNAKATESLQRAAATDLRSAATSPSGDFNLKGWQRWMQDNQDFLEAFPAFKNEAQSVARQHGIAKQIEGNFRQFLDTDPELAVSTLLSGKNPVGKLQDLKKQIGNSPQLLENLRRGFVDHALTNLVDAQGAFTPAKVGKFVDRNEKALAEVFSPKHLNNWKYIAKDLASESWVDRSARLASKGGSPTQQFQSVAEQIKGDILKSLGKPGQIFADDVKRNTIQLIASAVAGISGGGFIGAGATQVLGSGLAKIGTAKLDRATREVNSLLLKAAQDPQFASMLAQKPSIAAMKAATSKLGELIAKSSDLIPALSARIGGSSARSPAPQTAEPSQAQEIRPGQTLQSSSNPTPVANSESTNMGTIRPKAPALLGVKRMDSMPKELTAPQVIAQDADSIAPLVKAVIKQESGGNPKAKSEVGASGLMQIMPATAKEIAKELGYPSYDLADPETNQVFGTHYLRKLLNEFGDVELALTAYHSGPGRVRKLLDKTGGSTLADILPYLGPVGQKYAKQVIARLGKQKVVQV